MIECNVVMDKKQRREIHRFIIDFFKSRCGKPLFVSSEDCCSEMARLVGYRILKKKAKAKAYILKGKLSDSLEHDILAVKLDGLVILIDPTIWQIFRNKKNIFLGEYADLEEAINQIKNLYGGSWQMSEELFRKNIRETEKLLKILEENIQVNCDN